VLVKYVRCRRRSGLRLLTEITALRADPRILASQPEPCHQQIVAAASLNVGDVAALLALSMRVELVRVSSLPTSSGTHVTRALRALTTFKTLKTDSSAGFVTGSLIGPWPGELFAGALEAGSVGLLGSKRVADVITVARRRGEADKARIIPVMNWQPTAPAA
jgi:hypothetical protein